MNGKVVILDSGFCVLLPVIGLKKMGVFSAAFIKKRRYWQQYVNGEEIKAHFEDAPVGDIQIFPGTINGVKFYLFCLKDPDYVMTLMSGYGSLHTNPNQKESVRTDDKGEFYKNVQIYGGDWEPLKLSLCSG